MSKKPTLYLTVGIPCSGKTTWAEENAEKLNAVNINFIAFNKFIQF